MSGMIVGVGFMIAGAILVAFGALGLGRDDLIHTLATVLIVFGAVVISVATEATDKDREEGEALHRS